MLDEFLDQESFPVLSLIVPRDKGSDTWIKQGMIENHCTSHISIVICLV